MKFGKRVNLHTHTFRCKHAVGAPREYCAEAVRQGLCTLGFSDHQPFPDGRFDESRMPFGDLEAYAREIETARQEFPELNILTGLEADYVRALGKSFYEEEFFNKRKFDYLILGPHFNDPPEAGAGAGAAENVRLRVESESQVGRARCPEASGLYGVSAMSNWRHTGMSSRSSSRYSRL